MQIFNIQLNGSDAKEFCNQSQEFKIEWIKTHTNQTNEEIIIEFLSRPLKEGKCGCGCGEKKAIEQIEVKEEQNISPKSKFKKKFDKDDE